MIFKIESDLYRFQNIVKGRIKKNLKKYMSQGELIGKQGNNLVSIPLLHIELPRFRYDLGQGGLVGQGEGNVGTPVSTGQEGELAEGEIYQAGDQPGDHVLEVDVTLEELARMMEEELKLPRIQPKGSGGILSESHRYSNILTTGPESLRHFKRTYKEALKRQISAGEYSPEDPIIVPIKRDKKYRSWKKIYKPEHNAVILYMMDVSGSMGDEQKEIVRMESFWIDTWLRHQYHRLECCYIVHDAAAKEVDKETFFHLRESGGTLISSAYRLCADIIEGRYPPENWNIYCFHFSDGDNWSGEDTRLCMEILEGRILRKVNLFCYGQVESRYGSGQFLKDLCDYHNNNEKVVTSKIEDKEAIYRSIKDFLGTGR